MLGAAGAVESIFAILSVYNDIAPPTLNCESPDLVSKTDKREDGSEWDGPDSVDDGSDNVLDFTPLKARKRTVRAAMNNSFGFGGTNASLVFAKVDDDICGDFDDVE